MPTRDRTKPARPADSFAENGLAQWVHSIAARAPRNPYAARELATALRLIAGAYSEVASSVKSDALDEAAAVATRQLVRCFEARPRRFRAFVACWPDFPALVPLVPGDRKKHLAALEKALSAGTKLPGARARTGAKPASRMTPINRLAAGLARGVLSYRGREYIAPFAAASLSRNWNDIRRLPAFPCSRAEMKSALDDLLVPFLKSVVRHPRNFAHVPGLESIGTKHRLRKSGAERGADWSAPGMESAERDAWTRAQTKLSAAFVRLGLVKSA